MERSEHVTEVTSSEDEATCVRTKEVLACHCCEYKCSKETSMILHLVHHHDFTNTSAESQVTGFLYEGDHYCCQACAFLSPSRLMFQEHIRCHTFATPYTCAACSQAVNLKHVLAHYHTSHSKTLAPAIHVAASSLVDEIMQKLGPAAPFSISEIPISPQPVNTPESQHSAKNGKVDNPDSCSFASPNSSERNEEPLPSPLGLTDCQHLQVLVTNCNYTDGSFVCGLCRFSTQYLPVISKHLHADVQRWNCNCVGCRSSHYSNCIVITAAMTKLKKKLQAVGKEKTSSQAGSVSPMVIAAVSSDPELNQNNIAVCSNQPSTSLQQEYCENSKPMRSKKKQSSVNETTEMAQRGPEEASCGTSSTSFPKEGKKVQTVKLLCDLVDDTYVCKSCKFYEQDATLFRKHLWDDIHQYGDCTHNSDSNGSNVDTNDCTILNSLMQMLLIRRNDIDRHKESEQNGNTPAANVDETTDAHVERSRTRTARSTKRSNPNEPPKAGMRYGGEELHHEDGSETAKCVQNQKVSEEKNTHDQVVNAIPGSLDDVAEADSEESEFFRCGFINCRSSFSVVAGLKKHILSAHKSMNVYPCPYCSCLWPDYNHLMEHIPAHSGPTPYRCVQCDVCFEKNTLLKDHLDKMHRVNKLFKCTFDGCEFVSNIWTEFKMHNFTFHPSEQSYTCFACDTKLNKLSTYFFHIESGMVTLICCSYCPMKSKMRHTILRHSNSVHQGLDLKLTVQTEVKCATEHETTQPKTFHATPSSEQLVLYKCGTCDFASENKASLTEHTKCHEMGSGLQFDFCCPFCPFGSALLQGFNMHLADHRDKTMHHFRYYKCTHCPYTSNQMVLIEKHLQEKHTHKLFKFEVQQEVVTSKISKSDIQQVVVRGKGSRSEVLKEIMTSKDTKSEIQKDVRSKDTKSEIQQDVTGKDIQSEIQQNVTSKDIQSEIQQDVVTSKGIQSEIQQDVTSKDIQSEIQQDVVTSKGIQSEIQQDVTSKGIQSEMQQEVTSQGIQSEIQQDVTSQGIQSEMQQDVTSQGIQFEMQQDVTSQGIQSEMQQDVTSQGIQSEIQQDVTSKGTQSQVQKEVQGNDSQSKMLQKNVMTDSSKVQPDVVKGKGSKSKVQTEVKGKGSQAKVQTKVTGKGSKSKVHNEVSGKGSMDKIQKEVVKGTGSRPKAQTKIVKGKGSGSNVQKVVVTGKGSTHEVQKEVVNGKDSLVESAPCNSTMSEHGSTMLPDCGSPNLQHGVTAQSSKHHSESCRSGGISLKRKLVILLERCDVPGDNLYKKECDESSLKKELVDETTVSSEFLPVIQSVKTEIEEDLPAPDSLAKDSTAIERFHCELCVFSCSEWSRLHEHIKASHENVTQWNNVSLSVTTAVNMDSPKLSQIRPSKLVARKAEEKNADRARDTDMVVGGAKGEMRYHCNLCMFVCELWETFKLHMFDDHSYRAIKVDMTLPCQNIMAIPIEKPKPIPSQLRQFVCNKCAFSTDVKSNFCRHKKGHSQKLKSGFKCMYCSYSSPHKFVITKHVKNYHPDKSLDQPHVVSLQARKTPTISMTNEQTRVCTRQAKSKLAVQSSVTSEPPALEQEPDLQSETQSEERCDEHTERDRIGSSSSSSTVDSSTYCTRVDNHDLYQCRQCEFLHRFPSKVLRHFNYCHTKHCPYQCGYCNFQSVESGKVKRHCGFAHRGQAPKVIKVDVVAKTSEPFGVLMSGGQKNEDIETEEDGERPTEDSQWFWRRHVKTSNNQMMSCRLCGYRQVGASALKRHILSIHLGFSPFACKYCNFATTEIRYVKQHIEKTHLGLACKVIRRKYVSESDGEVHNEHSATAAALGVMVGRAMSTTAMADTGPTQDTPAGPSSACGVSMAGVAETHKACATETFANVTVKTEPVPSEPLPNTPPRQKHHVRNYKCIYCNFYSDDRFIFEIRDHIFEVHLHRDHFLCAHCRFGSMKKDVLVAHTLNKHPGKDKTVREDKTYARNIVVLETHGNMRMVGVLSNDKVPLIELPQNAQNEKQLCRNPLVNEPATQCELMTANVALNNVVRTYTHEQGNHIVSGHGVTMNTRSLRSDKSQTPTPTLPTLSKAEHGSTSCTSSTPKRVSDTPRRPSPPNSISESPEPDISTQQTSEQDIDSRRLSSFAPKRGSDRLRSISSSPRWRKEGSVLQSLFSSISKRSSDRLNSMNDVHSLPSENGSSQRSTSSPSSTAKRSSDRLSSTSDVTKLPNEDSNLQSNSSPVSSTKRDRDKLRRSTQRLPNEDNDSQRSRSCSPFSSTTWDSSRTRSCTQDLPIDESDSQRRISPLSSTKPASNRLRSSIPKLLNDESDSQKSFNPSDSTTKRGSDTPRRSMPKLPNEESNSKRNSNPSGSTTKRGRGRTSSSNSVPKLQNDDSDSHRSSSPSGSITKRDRGRTSSRNSVPKLQNDDNDSQRNSSLSGLKIKRGRGQPSSKNFVSKLQNDDTDSQRSPISSTKRGSDRRSSTRRLPKGSHRNTSSTQSLPKDDSDSHRSTSSIKKWESGSHRSLSPSSSISKSVKREGDVKTSTVIKKKLKIKKNADDSGVCDFRGKESDSSKKALKSDADEMYTDSADSVVSWKCKTCGLQLPKLEKMRRHVLTHHLNMLPYQCAVCDFADKKVKLVEEHIRRKHRKSRIHIPVLNMMDEQSDCLRKKMVMIKSKSVETKRLRTSRRKGTRFNYNGLRVTDTNGETLYRCDLCDHQVRVKASIINHRKSHFKFHPLGCGYCDYRTSSRFFLQSHNNDVHAGRPLKSRTISRNNDDDINGSVDKDESNQKKMASRKRRHSASPAELHIDDQLADDDDGLEPTFMCQTCGKKMLLKSSMERHVMVAHLGYRPYRCSDCDYSAVNKGTVQSHIGKKHAGTSCLVVYKKDERLEAIVQTCVVRVTDTLEPTLPTSFVCAVCKTYKTNSRSRIASHIADEVKYAPHQCPYCLLSSSRRDVIKSHVLEAHPHEKLTLLFNARCLLKQRVQELIEQSIVRTESDVELDFDVYRFNDNVLREKSGI